MNFIGKLHMNSNIARISSVSSQFEVQIRGNPEIDHGWCLICLEIQQKMNKKSFTKHVRHVNFPGGAAWVQILLIIEHNLPMNS